MTSPFYEPDVFEPEVEFSELLAGAMPAAARAKTEREAWDISKWLGAVSMAVTVVLGSAVISSSELDLRNNAVRKESNTTRVPKIRSGPLTEYHHRALRQAAKFVSAKELAGETDSDADYGL